MSLRTPRSAICSGLAVIVAGLQACVVQGQVVLRHGEPPPVGAVVAVSTQGVTVGSATVAPVLVPWARVLDAGDSRAASYAELADLAWRAPLRFARGDTLTAEPMFERLLVLLGDETGPTTRAAWYGLMRCQLARGADDLAVVSWSHWVDAKADEGSMAIYRVRNGGNGRDQSDRVVEPEGFLLPELAPFWSANSEPSVVATMPVPRSTQTPPTRGELLLAWYRSAARLASGLTPEFPDALPNAATNDEDVQLVRDCVEAQSSDRSRSRAARERLLDRLEGARGQWAQAWMHAAIGRSLIDEQDRTLRELGVVHLLHVPAQWGVVTPALAKMALADASKALGTLGDSQGRQAVEAELRRLKLASTTPEETFP